MQLSNELKSLLLVLKVFSFAQLVEPLFQLQIPWHTFLVSSKHPLWVLLHFLPLQFLELLRILELFNDLISAALLLLRLDASLQQPFFLLPCNKFLLDTLIHLALLPEAVFPFLSFFGQSADQICCFYLLLSLIVGWIVMPVRLTKASFYLCRSCDDSKAILFCFAKIVSPIDSGVLEVATIKERSSTDPFCASSANISSLAPSGSSSI